MASRARQEVRENRRVGVLKRSRAVCCLVCWARLFVYWLVGLLMFVALFLRLHVFLRVPWFFSVARNLRDKSAETVWFIFSVRKKVWPP